MKTANAFFAAIILGIAAPAVGASKPDYVVQNHAVSRGLIFAFSQSLDSVDGLEKHDGKYVVKDEEGEAAIVCEQESNGKCRFSPSLTPSQNSQRKADQVVFHALVNGFEKRKQSERVLGISLYGNKNRTFVELKSSYTPAWKLSHAIECNATPARDGQGFTYASCNYEISRAAQGGEAENLYQKLKNNSDVSSRLATLESRDSFEIQEVKIVRKIDWLYYGWRELHVNFVGNKQDESPQTGDLAGVYMRIFVNGIRDDGKVLTEKVREFHNRFIRSRR